MIKFAAGDLIGFGLSEANIEKLKQGSPISINLEEVGVPNKRAVIFYGKTEQEMQKDLAKHIGPETKYSSTLDN